MARSVSERLKRIEQQHTQGEALLGFLIQNDGGVLTYGGAEWDSIEAICAAHPDRDPNNITTVTFV